MDAITNLHNRQSFAKLTEPAPQGEQREAIFAAALTAPDHAGLRPWRFLVVEGEQRQVLGETMLKAGLLLQPDMDEMAQEKLRNSPMRAPLLVVAIAQTQEHAKVPEVEQLLSAGAAVTQMLAAIHALGYAAIWRTGKAAFNRHLMDALGMAANEKIVGFVYVGTAAGKAKSPRNLSIDDFFENWPGQ